MKKRLITIATVLGLGGLLAGCRSQITTTAKTYQQTGIVATIKGHAAGKTIRYRIGNGKPHTASVHNHSFVVTVAPTLHEQTVTLLSSHAPRHQVTVEAATPLGSYPQFAQRYNQIITMAHLSPKQQRQLQAATAIKKNPQAAQSNPQLLQQAQQAQDILAQARKKTRACQLPAYRQGVHPLVRTNAYTLRGNMQDNQLMGVTMIIPLHSLKDKQAARQFGTAFMALSQACGANGKQVLQAFKRATNHQKTQQTTLKTITNHGVHYQVAFSPNGLYVYVTK